MIVLAEPLEVFESKVIPLIELIPPAHQHVYKMGSEHLGVVVGDTFDTFLETHKPVLTGQEFQGPTSTPDPTYVLFEDFTYVKFYRLSLGHPSSSMSARSSPGSITSMAGFPSNS